MDYQLVVVRGRSASTAIKLADGVTTVGRHDECQLRIKSSQVSRKHCEIFEKKGLLLVKDLGSSNGTFVNGKRIKEQRVLVPGDEIAVGQVQLRVMKVGGPMPEATAPAPGAKKPGDTSVVEPVDSGAGADAGGDDDFDIEFDEAPEPAEAEPTVAAPPAPEAPKTQAPAPAAAEAAAEPAHEPGPADDAIADFLLDIKLEDE